MRKKLLSLVLALVMCLGLTVPAMAHDIQRGTTVWTATNAPVGTETVKVDRLEYPDPRPVESSGIDGDLSEAIAPISSTVAATSTGEKNMQTFPAGTVITVKTPGYVVDEWTKEKSNNTTVYVQQYNLQSKLVTEYTTSVSNFSLTLSDSNSYYVLQIGMSGLEMAPAYVDEFWFVKAASTSRTPAPSEPDSAPGFAEPAPSKSANNVISTYSDEHITVTNVTSTGKGQYTVDVEEHPEESWPEITCNAPAEITLDMSKASVAQYAPLATYWDSERTDITGGKITLTQPGTYVIDYFYGEGYYQCYYIVVKNGTAPSGNVTSFTDVAADAYCAAPVAWAVEKGITNGTGNNKFSPGQNCTNAQILTFLWRAYGEPEPSIGNPFTNSIPDAFIKAAIWAYEKGMVSGTAFDVDTPCTRAMAVTYMWQAAGSPMPFASADSFTDVAAEAPYALAVAWALEKSITTGTSAATFSPNDICNRGQIVTFLHRNLA